MEPDWTKATDLILSFEAFRPYVYDDAFPNRRYTGGTVSGTLTIGFGTTRPDIIANYLNKEMSPEEAYRIYKEQVPGYWEAIKRHFTVNLNPYQAAALTSLSYNSGGDGIKQYAPALLRAINEGRFAQATEIWKTSIIMVGSVFEQGLRNRRKAEAALFALPYKHISKLKEFDMSYAMVIHPGESITVPFSAPMRGPVAQVGVRLMSGADCAFKFAHITAKGWAGKTQDGIVKGGGEFLITIPGGDPPHTGVQIHNIGNVLLSVYVEMIPRLEFAEGK